MLLTYTPSSITSVAYLPQFPGAQTLSPPRRLRPLALAPRCRLRFISPSSSTSSGSAKKRIRSSPFISYRDISRSPGFTSAPPAAAWPPRRCPAQLLHLAATAPTLPLCLTSLRRNYSRNLE